MPFLPVPSESKNQINKAGEILKNDNIRGTERDLALNLANRWRACHAYPINTFQSTLRNNIRIFSGNVIVAQRLKRMPTIIDKLKRYPAMKLTTMQDIGGIRSVLSTVDDVYKLATIYKTKSRFRHELVDEHDYIQNPRNEDGYRSLHLIYKYKNSVNPRYDGLKIEFQIRTKLQHTWATAVETMGTILGQALKSRRGDKEWIDYFAITSSAIAMMENTPLIPRFQGKTEKEICNTIREATATLGAIDLMKGFSTTIDYIVRTRKTEKSHYYYLLILNSMERKVSVQPYNRDSFDIALREFSEYEEAAVQGEKIEPVLVSAGPLEILKRAYPNFFLDVSEFIKIIESMISKI